MTALAGAEAVTNNALLTASYITTLTFAEGEYGNANEGTWNVPAFIFNVVALRSIVAALLTVTSPLMVVDPVISVDPDINTDWNNGFI
jgi:hypothetical protein